MYNVSDCKFRAKLYSHNTEVRKNHHTPFKMEYSPEMLGNLHVLVQLHLSLLRMIAISE